METLFSKAVKQESVIVIVIKVSKAQCLLKQGMLLCDHAFNPTIALELIHSGDS